MDIFGNGQRTIGLRTRAEFVDPLGGGSRLVPFQELRQLGGLNSLRGFRSGRFHGRSVVMATLAYRYPVWTLFDAEWFYELGNAFGAGRRDFADQPGALLTSEIRP